MRSTKPNKCFAALVENSPDIIARYDRDCRRTYVNPTYLKVAQIPQQELLASAPIQRSPLPAASAAVLQNLLRRVLDSGVAEAIDVIWPKADNIDYWYNIYAFPEFDREGRVVSVMTVSRDITERKQAEEKNLWLAAIVESSDDAIIGKTLDGIITSWNKGAENIYGYKDSEALGKPISILVPPDRQDELSLLLARINRGDHVEHCETVRRKKDGREFDISLTISPIRNAKGRIIGASTIARDITESKRAEKEIHRSQVLLETIVQNMPVQIFVKEAQELRFVLVNRECEAVTGYPAEELLGRTDYDFFPTEQAEFFVSKDRETISKGVLVDIPEEVLESKSGDTKVLHTRKVPIIDESGKPLYLLGISEDITAQKSLQRQLFQAQKMEAIGYLWPEVLPTISITSCRWRSDTPS